MAKDTYWFSHDYNARNDNKIKKLIAKHGFAGYGLFWAIIEELYNNDNILSKEYDLILSDRKAKPEIIQSIVEDFELFVVDGDHFGSTSVEKRLNERNSKSKKASDSANLRWKKTKDDANALRPHDNRNAIYKGKDNIVKDKKEKIETAEPPADLYSDFISDFNSLMGKKYTGDKKSKQQFAARLKEGFSRNDFVVAIQNAMQDKFQQDTSFVHLTPEYLTRPNILQKWMNFQKFEVISGTKPLTENEKQRLRFQQLKETNNEKLAANDNI